MSLDGISMHPLAIELDRAITGGRIDKINQPNKQSVILSVRQPGKNYLVHISINPQNPAVHAIIHLGKTRFGCPLYRFGERDRLFVQSKRVRL